MHWVALALAGALGCATKAPSPVDGREAERVAMVATQIERRGIHDARVLEAMRRVPRHEFVPARVVDAAYDDRPLPIGHDQTISQPYIVALMTDLAMIGPRARVLEVGTGSGYQAAVLAQMGADVYSIEIVEPLAREAGERLARLGYAVHVRAGDGYRGWPEVAPFDAILVTAAPPRIPEPLKEQLRVGGRLVVPVGVGYQELVVVTRTATAFETKDVIPVRFVPMTGEVQKP
ncbi:MAG TPA: protein-L-isoaspartate(D-aspartate) O-methyltransferase [Haliangiales bacterium]|nr:protein-L-isoaspartate(D-aspartate) O-methyltransferase [Haliangiales bacterium]